MTRHFWIGLLIIGAVSVFVTFFAPVSEIYKGVALIPGVGALLAALFQLARDEAAHTKRLDLQNRQNIFTLGATSHMANLVFDKHVEFSERYLAEVHELVVTLTREGPTKEALDHAGKLYDLRIEYTAWITDVIEEKLIPFETAVRRIGANSGFIDALSKSGDRETPRQDAIKEMYDIFRNLMDIGDSEVKDEDATVRAVKRRVREILQVDELVSIREHLVSSASDAANKKHKERTS